jgi:hypothetical protein
MTGRQLRAAPGFAYRIPRSPREPAGAGDAPAGGFKVAQREPLALHRKGTIVHRTFRNGLGGLVAALLLAAGGLTATTTTTAAAAAPRPVTIAADSFYKIRNTRTGKCVDVPASSHATRVLLQEWDCHGGDNQRWTPFDLGNGFFLLQSKNTTSMCMNVRLDFLIDQEPCNVASIDQQWQWEVVNNNGELALHLARPGFLCLGLSPDTAKNGTGFVPLTCSPTNSAVFWHPEF